MISTVFFAGPAQAAEGVPAGKPDPASLWAKAQEADDPALYCAAARAGSGPAQTYMGRMLTDEKAGARDLAAGMLWLDMAIRSGEAEARELRRAAGHTATSKDFERYRLYNNSQRPVPCEPVE